MSEKETVRRSPMRMAIIVLSVALVALAVFIAYLVWGNRAPTVMPPPTPQSSATVVTPTVSASPSEPAAVEATPPASEPTLPPSTAMLPATPAPSSPTTAIATATAAPAQTLMWDGLATFANLTVEVVRDDGGQDKEMIEGKAGLLVEVCGTKDGAPSSTTGAPGTWTLEDSLGNSQSPQQRGYQPGYPTTAVPAPGECLQGYLTFDYVSQESGYASLVYEDPAGNRAVWEFH